jgi:hypothetical protein
VDGLNPLSWKIDVDDDSPAATTDPPRSTSKLVAPLPPAHCTSMCVLSTAVAVAVGAVGGAGGVPKHPGTEKDPMRVCHE